MPRVHRPRGGRLPLRAVGRCSGRVIAERRLVPSCCWFTGHGETGCLPMSVVAAREGWLLRGR